MTAVLCRHFGLQHIEVAEDIASETFLKASEHWAIHGVPANPQGWLYTVAKNKAKDYFKRQAVFESRVKPAIQPAASEAEIAFEFSSQVIADSQLAMIFAVASPVNAAESQICLALQVLCGFSVEEIANAFLAKKETIKKRLLRARENLRNDNFQLNALNEAEISARLDTVLRTIYLLFNEGYFSKTDDEVIRRELCSEAVRLAVVLTEHALTNVAKVSALLALLCFQSSRLAARTNSNKETILFEEQDRSLWDQLLIDKGNHFLVNACAGNEVSKYHLEAAIAYWHTTPTVDKKWEHILSLYDQLIIIEYSPVTMLNRIFALAKVRGNAAGIAAAEELNMEDNCAYHELLGYLYTSLAAHKAIAHYNKAIELTKSNAEKKTLQKAIERLMFK
ncbi:MAG: RNA polymerase subunit sigma [Filimonas sp.]|nr:RNA polymerase subunit sigma [Filimonas sp.]